MHTEKAASLTRIFRSALLAVGFALLAAPAASAQTRPIPIVVQPSSAARAASVIRKSGSYILTRNITVTKAGADGVDVTVGKVTIDMQGFTISGVSGTGTGINASGQSQVTIKNGVISGMGGPAVIVGNQSTVSAINATGDSSSGSGPVIQAGSGSLLANNTVVNGQAVGISCGASSLARGNILQNNSSFGLQLSDATSAYAGNVLQGNSGNSATTSGQISGGTKIAENLCNGALCP